MSLSINLSYGDINKCLTSLITVRLRWTVSTSGDRHQNQIPYQVNEVVEVVSEVPKGIEMIEAPKIWGKSKGKGITVAILDTGCDVTHPDLR
jgi:subtilisin family serine protease